METIALFIGATWWWYAVTRLAVKHQLAQERALEEEEDEKPTANAPYADVLIPQFSELAKLRQRYEKLMQIAKTSTNEYERDNAIKRMQETADKHNALVKEFFSRREVSR